MIRYRKFFTSGLAFTFAIVAVTGVILKFLFKNHPLEEIHGWIGVTMLVAAVFHAFHNWGALRAYLKQPRVLALLLPLMVVVTFLALEPAQEGRGPSPKAVVKRLAAAKAGPLALAFGMNLEQVNADLAKDGLAAAGENETLGDLAKKNQKSLEVLLPYFFLGGR